MTKLDYDIVIIGGGSAGMASAIGAYDDGTKNIVILEKGEYLGGILLQCIHAGFGLQTFKEELTGPMYAERFVEEIKKRNIEYKLETMVTGFEKKDDHIEVTYSNATEGLKTISAKALIMAVGCIERTRGQIATPGDRPSGVMCAGVAQKYLNIDGLCTSKRVFILGSGDIGLIMARRMTLEGAKVLGVAEIMPYSNGLNRNIVQCLEDYNIPLYLHHTVKEIIGKDRLEKVVICEVDDNFNYVEGTEKEFEVDTLLLSIGLIPSTDMLVKAGVVIDPLTKSAKVDDRLETSIPGVFACGNGLHVHDLVDFVSKEGLLAGKNASCYVKGESTSDEVINVKNGNLIGYVLPQKTHKEDVTISFRVKKPLKNCYLIAKQGEKEIKRVKKLYLIPSEMDNIKLSKEIILDNEDIVIYVEEI